MASALPGNIRKAAATSKHVPSKPESVFAPEPVLSLDSFYNSSPDGPNYQGPIKVQSKIDSTGFLQGSDVGLTPKLVPRQEVLILAFTEGAGYAPGKINTD